MENGSRSAAEEGWRISRYNLTAKLPGTNQTVIANLYQGTCGVFADLELELMQDLTDLDAQNPLVERWSNRGLIVRFDERAALDTMGRGACLESSAIRVTICPTIGCNFDCPYCFETHKPGKMSPQVQDDTVALAERMLDASKANSFSVTWFGGEPLLAPDVIETLSERLIRICEERGVKYSASIVTNGYLLTEKTVQMLGRMKVTHAQVTLDGLGSTHDATRHLAGGGPTFERITANLRRPGIPFPVDIRHNVYEGNIQAVQELKSFVKALSEESGNKLFYYSAMVSGSKTADERGMQVELLCGENESGIGLTLGAQRFERGRGHFCGAQSMWCIGIDEQGNLHKCWENMDKRDQSFGKAADWNPKEPLATAGNPDRLTAFLNTACPTGDPECDECVWLPQCRGGCPYQRLANGKQCLPYREDPEGFVLALYRRMKEQHAKKNGGVAPEK